MLAAVVMAGCTANAPWNRLDKSLMGVSIACNAVDYAQTEWAMDHGYRELSPLMGEAPSDGRILGTKLATQALIYQLTDHAEHRTLALAMTIVPCLAVVAHNHSEGARP